MAKFKFDRASVENLLQHTLNSEERMPSVDQLLEKSFWKDEYKSREGGEEEELEEYRIDPRKVPAGLWLIQDSNGLYLTSNGSPADIPLPEDIAEMENSKIPEKRKNHIIWEFLPADHVSSACGDTDKPFIQISVTPKSISVIA